MICTKNGQYSKWYNKQGDKLTYIKKQEKELVENLAIKKYLISHLKELQHEKVAIEKYLKHHKINEEQQEQDTTENQEYQKLIASYMKSIAKKNEEWLGMKYTPNKNYPEHLIHTSQSGNILRSKSEVLIDTALFQHQIPYYYEAPLFLNGERIFPDFTICHPITGEKIYWEHFGMMNNPIYAQRAYNKLQTYMENGYMPMRNLIITFETRQQPLTTEMVEKAIADYLT